MSSEPIIQVENLDSRYGDATILETHHPEYLSEADLREIFEYNSDHALPASDLAQLASLIFRAEDHY